MAFFCSDQSVPRHLSFLFDFTSCSIIVYLLTQAAPTTGVRSDGLGEAAHAHGSRSLASDQVRHTQVISFLLYSFLSFVASCCFTVVLTGHRPSELLKCAWMKANRANVAPHVISLIDRFNQVPTTSFILLFLLSTCVPLFY